MANFFVGLLVIILAVMALLGAMFLAGMVMILGVALLVLLKIFAWVFVGILAIWAVGKVTLTFFHKKNKTGSQ